jgi:hypothetical protein
MKLHAKTKNRRLRSRQRSRPLESAFLYKKMFEDEAAMDAFLAVLRAYDLHKN